MQQKAQIVTIKAQLGKNINVQENLRKQDKTISKLKEQLGKARAETDRLKDLGIENALSGFNFRDEGGLESAAEPPPKQNISSNTILTKEQAQTLEDMYPGIRENMSIDLWLIAAKNFANDFYRENDRMPELGEYRQHFSDPR